MKLCADEILLRHAPPPASPFHHRQMSRVGEQAKQPVRDRVGEYLLSIHGPGPLRLLSLPSAYWAFERQIEAAHGPRCSFVGVEREFAMARSAPHWMPGKKPRAFEHRLPDRTIHGFRTDRAKLLHADLEDFIIIGGKEIRSRPLEREWRESYRRWTAVWLDFNSQISRGVESILPRIGCGCDMYRHAVPIAVTVMKGRESSDVSNKLFALWTDRAGYLSALLGASKYRRFELDDRFEHTTSRVRMLTVMGRLIPCARKDVAPAPSAARAAGEVPA